MQIRGKAKTAEGSRFLPPPRRGMRRPPFNTLNEDDFECLCDELASHVPGIVSTDLKRSRGVAQYSVDTEAFDDRHRPVLVVSAKRYLKATASQLRTWVNEFVEHWRRRGVRRFLLAVTVETDIEALQEQFTADTDRLASLSLDYECWGTNQLTGRIRPQARRDQD